jgi:hypothetical protein
MTRALRVWTGALTCATLVVLSGCDVPTGGNDPSLNTGTSIGAPLIAQKTYSFLGGPESENEPIIDTTSTSSNSLRASIEKVSSSTSNGGPQNKLSLNSGFSEVLVEEGDDLATQEVNVTVPLNGSAPAGTNVEFPIEGIDIQGGSPENNNFGAVDVADGSTLDLDVKNNTGATLEDVELTLENNSDAPSDFDAQIPSLNVTKQIGDINDGETGSASVTTWEDPTDRAIEEAIDVTVSVTAPTGFSDGPGDEIKIFLGGEGGASTLTAQTLYFRPEGETVQTSGTVDVLEPGRVDFGSNSYIELSKPTIDIKGLDIRGTNLDPKAQFQSFILRYPDDITFDGSDDPFEVDLVQKAPNFDGNARSCPCDPTVKLDKNIRFDGLQGNEDIEFELETTFENNPNSTAIISVGDEVRADDTGFPISETFRVNWGLTGNRTEEVTVRDTLDADFSGLEDLTESGNDVQLDKASLDFTYENTLPLGADLTLTVVDESGNTIRTLSPASSSSSDVIPLTPAKKDGDGNATTPFPNETITIDLGDRQRLQELADGRRIRLRMDMAQKQDGPAARIKAKDTWQFTLTIDADGTVNTGS